jgi:hypothetical protein
VVLAVRFIVESLLGNWTADFWKIKKQKNDRKFKQTPSFAVMVITGDRQFTD